MNLRHLCTLLEFYNTSIHVRNRVFNCVCACAWFCICACVRVRARVRVRVRVCLCVCGWFVLEFGLNMGMKICFKEKIKSAGPLCDLISIIPLPNARDCN